MGKLGIQEPKNHCSEINPSDIDLFLVPGVVFDRRGYRLGHGKGYYDRLLKNIVATKIGLAYDWQIIKEIPHEIHDVKMDFIITEKRLLGN